MRYGPLFAAAPELLAYVHNVVTAIRENGADCNLNNMLQDGNALLSRLGE